MYKNLELYKNIISNVRFYQQNSYNIKEIENFNQIPIITDEILFKKQGELINNTSNSSELLTNKSVNDLGYVIDVLWERNQIIQSSNNLWEIREKHYGITKNFKICQITPKIFDSVGRLSFLKMYLNTENTMLFLHSLFLDDNHLKNYCEKLIIFQPDWIVSTSRDLLKVGNYLKSNNNLVLLQKSLKYIELNELANRESKLILEELFGVPVINCFKNDFFHAIAYECPYGNFHIVSKNAYVEILDDDSKNVFDIEGDICISTLVNNTMPLLRYKNGYRGTLTKNIKCNCGCDDDILLINSTKKLNNEIKLGDKIIGSDFKSFLVGRLSTKFGSIFSKFILNINLDTITVNITLNKCDCLKNTKELEDLIRIEFQLLHIYNHLDIKIT